MRYTDVAVVFLLALLVVTAGCVGGDTDEPSATDAPETDGETEEREGEDRGGDGDVTGEKDNDTATPVRAAVSVSQEEGLAEVMFVSTETLKDSRLAGPNGTSVKLGEAVQPGTNIEVREGGYPEDEIEGNLLTPNEDECRITHDEQEIAGQVVDGADIPCDGSGIDGLEGDDVRYEPGAEYHLTGTAGGEWSVVQSFFTAE